jgi:hypothetical protein
MGDPFSAVVSSPSSDQTSTLTLMNALAKKRSYIHLSMGGFFPIEKVVPIFIYSRHIAPMKTCGFVKEGFLCVRTMDIFGK